MIRSHQLDFTYHKIKCPKSYISFHNINPTLLRLRLTNPLNMYGAKKKITTAGYIKTTKEIPFHLHLYNKQGSFYTLSFKTPQ